MRTHKYELITKARGRKSARVHAGVKQDELPGDSGAKINWAMRAAIQATRSDA